MLENRKFYWGTTRKAIVAFANLFNNVSITREDSKGTPNNIRVPLSYAPKDKFIARIQQQPDLDQRNVAQVFPRMSFEIGKIAYDNSRMRNANMTGKAPINGTVTKKYTPVPYNLSVSLFIGTKSQDEGLQIVEQILPNFRPSYTLSMNAIPEMGLTEDLNITLVDVDMDDTYEGDLSEKRMVIWTLSFVVQMNFHPAADNTDRGLIKRVEVGVFGNSALTLPTGEITHEVTPFEANPEDDFQIITNIEGFD